MWEARRVRHAQYGKEGDRDRQMIHSFWPHTHSSGHNDFVDTLIVGTTLSL